MIEISLGKLVLLALIALIVLGPEKLPGAARTAGALLRRVRSGWDNVRSEVERELEIEEIKRAAREAAAGAEAAQKEFKESMQQVHEPLAGVAAMLKSSSTANADDEPKSPSDAEAKPDPSATGAQSELPLEQPVASPTSTADSSHGGA
ncbi:MAG: Sec-independent protein translocase protein TatB [Rhodanobacter sp.]|jgi:sec-independent protein translocase protein TatB|nr:Sec-independent protein translocase protein TatB [Rhodanobacter sp.]